MKTKTKTYIFECYKCSHELHVDENKLDKVIKTECPNCGEEPYRLWILINIIEEKKK
ncbi:MAG: hypothetical protein JETCAE03_32200 [Ignavibacteriaceae bacterium]|jgi:predicted RNA-binding Zn-ribbon protein involved in translation (DUF1610 family)|nr:MAG: hypothetical protein JETCAE03_32200 [Ignavibacteriaceae bacterium]